MAQAAVPQLLQQLVEGVYLEPRSDESRGTDPGYAVVWLPGGTREVALHKLKMSAHGLSLVRMKQRFGIQVQANFEQATHRELRPSEDFHKVQVKHIYRLHPLPHGLQRAQISKLLKEWAWDARPLQPSRGTHDGGAWDVGASTAPSANTMVAFGHDVLITLVKDKQIPDRTVAVVGPRRVQKHLQHHAPASSSAGSGDPWHDTGRDPWGQYQGVAQGVVANAPIKRLDAITDKLKSDMEASVHSAASANPLTEARFQKLESGLVELQHQGQKFHQWFEETGTRLAAQDKCLHQVQQQMTQQHQDLAGVRSEFHTANASLQEVMQSSLQSVKHELAQDIGNSLTMQMERFEKLMFAKTPRTDS